jgi:hypothetical protein
MMTAPRAVGAWVIRQRAECLGGWLAVIADLQNIFTSATIH